MPWPDYGSPGAPNLDPYYMSEAQQAAWQAEEDSRAAMAAANAAAEEAERLADEALQAELSKPNWLWQWRLDRRLTRAECAEMLGLKERTLRALEDGTRPSAALLPILAKLTAALDALGKPAA